MKRLNTALDSKLKQGRPPKYCRMCHRELRKLIGSQLERRPLEKKNMKGRNITEQRNNISSAKDNGKTRKCSPLSSVAAKEVHINIRQSKKCHIFVRNIDKNVGFYVTTSIKGHNQREAIHLPKRFQWVHISVQSVNDSLQDQTV